MTVSTRGASATPDPQPDAELDQMLALTRSLVALAMRSVDAAGDTVSLPQFRALYVLDTTGPCSAGGLAEHLGTHASTVTRILDRLVTLGYATREVPAENRRLIELDITGAGRVVVRAVMQQRATELQQMLDALPATARRQLGAALPHLVSVAEGQHGQLPEGWAH